MESLLQGKIIIITGATGILGQHTITALLGSGATLVLTYRNPTAMATFLTDIRQNNPYVRYIESDPKLQSELEKQQSTYKTEKIELEKQNLKDDVHKIQIASTISTLETTLCTHSLDLACSKSVMDFIEYIKIQYPMGIYALLNIAGAFNINKTTEDGHQFIYQTNFLSPITLTKKLIPLLKLCPNSRVINVCSLVYCKTKIHPTDLERLQAKNPFATYANSKRLLAIATDILNSDKSNPLCTLCHPGISATNIIHYKNGGFSKGLYKVANGFMKVVFPSPEKASRTILHALFQDGSFAQPLVADQSISSLAMERDKIHARTTISSPRGLFQVWGKPKARTLKKFRTNEIDAVKKILDDLS